MLTFGGDIPAASMGFIVPTSQRKVVAYAANHGKISVLLANKERRREARIRKRKCETAGRLIFAGESHSRISVLDQVRKEQF